MEGEELLNALKDEQIFPYEKMSIQERDFYLKILKSCKDISDSNIKSGDEGKCDLVYIHLIKYDNYVHANGYLSLGKMPYKENRCIDAKMYFKEDKITVKMNITRLCVYDSKKEYTVTDEFTLENNKIKRVSKYDYRRRKISDIIQNEEMKGRLK